MFRRRAPAQGRLDSAALEANCRIVVDELAADFDWGLRDRDALARRVAARAAERLGEDQDAAADLGILRRTLEREACAEYFAALYDELDKGDARRGAALTELFRPEEQDDPDGPRTVYRGYLYRAAVFYLLRWTGRKGWTPPPDEVEEIARATAEDVVMALLRGVELREGPRAFWSYLSTAVERRTIDHLRALTRRGSTVSLDEMEERLGREWGGEGPAAGDDPLESAALAEVSRLMEVARLSPEERFSLVAGAYGLNDTEAAEELARRSGRGVGPADIRRWRFRGRDKLRRSAGEDP
jgi:DNA-directed RNA polymerase specialized sigma24 family protein